MTDEDDEALERRVRTRMAFEKAKTAFLAADARGQDLINRLSAAIAGLTRRDQRIARAGVRYLTFNASNPNEWLHNLPTADAIASDMTEWAQRRKALQDAYKALDPIDTKEVRLPEGFESI